MQLFLSLVDSTKEAPNENFARELLELFTLGSGYTERDVREAARALTGYTADWSRSGGVAIRYDPDEHDDRPKRILGSVGRFGVDDTLDLVVQHPRHAPFLVRKLWDFFVATPPSRATIRSLAATYRASGLRVKPVVRQILDHPSLYRRLDEPDMVKSPVVYVAGALRTTGSYVTNGYPTWLLPAMGQELFAPPSVAGWDWGAKWMSSNAMRQRFTLANYVVGFGRPRVRKGLYRASLTPADAFMRAYRATGEPQISTRTRRALIRLARHWYDDIEPRWRDEADFRADALQITLRHLLIAGPDSQLH
jgi:uncharacterized protein (DUF1800 family)